MPSCVAALLGILSSLFLACMPRVKEKVPLRACVAPWKSPQSPKP